MSGVKISGLPPIPSSAFSDIFPAVQAGVTYKTTLTQLATLLGYSGGILSLAQGGTSANLTANNGGIVYSTASAMAILAGTATAGQIIRSGANSAPSWSTTTYPATNAINTIMYASSANVLGVILPINSGTLVSDAGGIPTMSQTLPLPVQSNITQLGTQSRALNMGGFQINNGATPTQPTDYAIKSYVDQTALTGTSVYAATTGNLTVTQSGTGVGATLTNAGAQATFALDGVNPPVNSNVLVKDLAAPQHEGIYTVTNVGSGATNWVLTRAVTYDTPSEINGTGLIIVQNGSTLSGTAWYNSSTIVTVDTTNFNYNEFGNITFPITLAHGGTNANLTASNGGIFYSTGSAGAILSGTATANQVLLSGSSSAPAWSTATYPATTTVNQILYSSSSNVIGGITTANSGVLITSAGGVPSISTTLPSGIAASGMLLTSPRIITSILDTNGNNIFTITAAGSAVNYLNVGNAATGTDPFISATGSDASVPLALLSKGGIVYIGDNTGTNGGEIALANNTGSHTINLTVPSVFAASQTFVLPTTDGTANAPLITDGSGNLSFLPGAWVDISGSIAVTGCSGSPTIISARSKQIGKTLFFYLNVSGTSNATTFTITGMPVAAHVSTSSNVGVASNNSAFTTAAYWAIAASGTTLTLSLNNSTTGWTNSGGKSAAINGFYETT